MEIRIATKQDRQAVFALRTEVFVEEQGVPPELETDEKDAAALHILAEHEGHIVGCARVILGRDGAFMGRLAVKKTCRGQGIGAAIVRFIMRVCRERGCAGLCLHAQCRAVGFYETLGFVTEGESFWEAGIEHIHMRMPAENMHETLAGAAE